MALSVTSLIGRNIVYGQYGPTPTSPPGPTFNVSGDVRVDSTTNNCASGSTVYPSPLSLTLTNLITLFSQNTSTNPADGSYSFSPSPAGNYEIALSLPSGYKVVALNGSSYSSNTNTFTLPPDRTANWCIRSLSSWYQTDIGDVRQKIVANPVPGGQYAASDPNNPSVFYSSQSPSSFSPGNASQKGWVVDSEYDYNRGVANRTGTIAYSFYVARSQQTGTPITTLSSAPAHSACVPGGTCRINNLGTGIYRVDGNLTIDGPGASPGYLHQNGNHVVLLINGNLTIRKKVEVPTGQGNLLVIAVKGNIVVDRSVGETVASSTTTNLDGIYSAEGSFIAEGDGCPAGSPDRRLNLGGAVIANALRPFSITGTGTLQNQRSLCSNDLLYPSINVQTRGDFLLQLTDFYKTAAEAWRQVNP